VQRAFHTDMPPAMLEEAPETRMLRDAGVEVSGERCGSEDETIQHAAGAQAILNGMVPITRRVLEALPELKVVARYGVGVDNVDLEAATKNGVAVVYVPDYCVEEVSNQALAFLLGWARQVPRWTAMLREGRWGYDYLGEMRSVHGEVLGVIGMGRIGATLARKAAAFGLEVLGHDPGLSDEDLRQRGAHPLALDALLERSDYVSLHAPLQSGTHHLIGAAELARMKPSAFLINTSRGAVVDESALIDALRGGRIAGAGLDVFEAEPLAPESPLRQMDQVLLSPHMGAQSPRATEKLRRSIAEEVLRALRGEWPLNVANPDVRGSARLLA
jgi:D-3-phosphoglycerate dehydrogenase